MRTGVVAGERRNFVKCERHLKHIKLFYLEKLLHRSVVILLKLYIQYLLMLGVITANFFFFFLMIPGKGQVWVLLKIQTNVLIGNKTFTA